MKTSWQKVLKMSGRRMTKTNILVLIKTSWRRVKDIFWRRLSKVNVFVLIKTFSSRRMFAGYMVSNWSFAFTRKCLEDVLRPKLRGFRDVFATSLCRLGSESYITPLKNSWQWRRSFLVQFQTSCGDSIKSCTCSK